MRKEGKTKRWLWVLVGIAINLAFFFISTNYLLFSYSLPLILGYLYVPPVIGIILFFTRKDKFKYIGGGIIITFGIEMLMGLLYGL